MSVEVALGVYLDLADRLRRSGDTRPLQHIVTLAVQEWLATRDGAASAQGYQWKTLFLPEGADLRMRHRGTDYFAKVAGGKLKYDCLTVTPNTWVLMITGTVRNPWRDIWVRRNVHECWTHASALRAGAADPVSFAERRIGERRRNS